MIVIFEIGVVRSAIGIPGIQYPIAGGSAIFIGYTREVSGRIDGQFCTAGAHQLLLPSVR